MQDFLELKDKIKSINYDNGLRKSMNQHIFGVGEIYEIPDLPEPIQTLTIDFGDSVFEIVGKVTWKLRDNQP